MAAEEKTDPSGTYLALVVQDTGQGIASEELPYIFDRFWRKDAARTGGNHAGLGLSLVKALADILNVRIRALLESGERFTMSLSDRSPA